MKRNRGQKQGSETEVRNRGQKQGSETGVRKQLKARRVRVAGRGVGSAVGPSTLTCGPTSEVCGRLPATATQAASSAAGHLLHPS
ncbi:hypothetical protein ACOMHN_016444 [Nucella lapillus]